MLAYIFLLYLPLYFFSFLSCFWKSKIFLIFPVVVFILFTSLRYMIGWDYVHYYNVVEYGVDNNITSREEYLTILVVSVARFFNSPFIYFFINACLFFVLFARFIYRHSFNVWLSCAIFLGFPLFYLNSLSVVRTFTAIAVVLYALEFLIKRRIFVYVFLVFIASLFHKAALFSLLFSFFLYVKLSTLNLIVIAVAAPFFKGLLFSFLTTLLTLYFPSYLVYLEPSPVQEGTKAIFVLVFFAVMMLLMRDRFFLKDAKYDLLLNIYIFGVLFYFIFLEFGTLGHRLTLYSTILLTVLLPFAISKIKYQSIRFSINLSLHLLFISFFCYYLKAGGEVYIPYRTILG